MVYSEAIWFEGSSFKAACSSSQCHADSRLTEASSEFSSGDLLGWVTSAARSTIRRLPGVADWIIAIFTFLLASGCVLVDKVDSAVCAV